MRRALRRPLHMGAWGFAADGCSGVKTNGGREKIFSCVLWVLGSPISKPPICYCICFSGDLMPERNIFIGSAHSSLVLYCQGIYYAVEGNVKRKFQFKRKAVAAFVRLPARCLTHRRREHARGRLHQYKLVRMRL